MEAITSRIDVPEDFAADMVKDAGAAGQAWIDGLSALIDELCSAKISAQSDRHR